ncbi:hypothetical protein J6590_010861 [Homalodisca vitripennis]|nr:hypothetical protein J6590_010861 [Homalodisca vitripennis]
MIGCYALLVGLQLSAIVVRAQRARPGYGGDGRTGDVDSGTGQGPQVARRSVTSRAYARNRPPRSQT